MKFFRKTNKSDNSLKSLQDQVQLVGLRDGQLDQHTDLEEILRAEMGALAEQKFGKSGPGPETLESARSKLLATIDDLEQGIENHRRAGMDITPVSPPRVSVWRWGAGLFSLGGLWLLYESLNDPRVLNLTYLGILLATCVSVLSLLPFLVSLPGRLSRVSGTLGRAVRNRILGWRLDANKNRLGKVNISLAHEQEMKGKQAEWIKIQLAGLLGQYESYRTTGVRLMQENTHINQSLMEAKA